MGSIYIQILLFLFSLSLLIVLHEFGHYITARWFKVRVLKFYLFFDFLFPFPNLANFSLFKKKIGDTEFGIGWFPLGGYVQMAGIMDESMDKEALKEPIKPYEFRAKPAWQRLIILLGGIIVNVLLAFFIYAMVMFTWGEEKLYLEDMPYGLYADSLAVKYLDMQHGDVITYIEDTKLVEANEETLKMMLTKAQEITIQRGDQEFKKEVPREFYQNILKGNNAGSFVDVALPPVIGEFSEGSALEKAGAQEGDRIIRIDKVNIDYFQDIPKLLQCKGPKYKTRNLFEKLLKKPRKFEREPSSVYVEVLRSNDTIPLLVEVAEEDRIGFYPVRPLAYQTITYSLAESFPAGVRKSMDVLDMYIDQFSLMWDRDIQGYKYLGGFGAIGGLFPKEFDWRTFWNLTAFLSIMLAFLNLMPIPALDGGHALFTVYEMIFRRAPNDRFMEIAQTVGMLLLLALVLFANGNDIYKAVVGSPDICELISQ